MKLYLDTEFNGFGGELLSMAIVAEDGQEFYEVLPAQQFFDAWVEVNVVPKFNKNPIDPTVFRQTLHEFLLRYHSPEIICDWHADAMYFCQWLGGSDYGSSLDYACRISILKTPSGFPVQSADSHNALCDARALMDWHQKVAA